MAKVITDEQGRVILSNNKALTVPGTSPDIELPKYTGHVDTEGLTALGWDSDDIAWLQAHVWWDAEDDEYWAVTEANLAFGPNGATPLTWANRASIKTNPDVRYFPKFDPSPSSDTSWNALFSAYIYLCAIPTHGWDTSKVTSLSGAFLNCYSLRSVGDLSDWDITKVVTLSSMFQSCFNLISIGDLSQWDTSSVHYMSSVFLHCRQLRGIGNLSNWDISTCTTIAGMFQNCSCLSTVGELSGWDVSNITSFSALFANCYCLDGLDLSNWDTSKVTNTANMFNGCHNLKYVGDLSKWDMSEVTACGSMFANCFELQSIGDLSEWDLSKATSLDTMFGYLYKLKGLGDISKWNTESNTTLSYAFSGIFFLGVLDLANFVLTLVTNISRCFYSCLTLTELDLSNWDTSAVTNVGTSAATSPFSDCRSLRVLKLGPKFFNFTPAKIYINQCSCWTRDSIYESLYTNQTLRNTSSPAKTVALSTDAYDSLSVQDIEDIATKNITLTRE